MNDSLYDTDIVLWSEQQAAALRRRAANEIDWDNVAEEIADVAQRNRDRIEDALVTAIVHLLKWQHQRLARSNAWRGIVVAERNRIARLIRRNPSSPTIRSRCWPKSIPTPAHRPRRRRAWRHSPPRARGPSNKCSIPSSGRTTDKPAPPFDD
jgi:hypothetical protein